MKFQSHSVSITRNYFPFILIENQIIVFSRLEFYYIHHPQTIDIEITYTIWLALIQNTTL